MTTPVKVRKKLIEVALPLEAINKASAHEKLVKVGKPTNLHLWWARRPLAAARAVIFAQMVDDPTASPDLFPTVKAQDKERQRLFLLIEQLVKWENTANEIVLAKAREEIWQSWRRTCAENADHPRARELFDRHTLPAFHDPFAGGGVLPLEAQRLGLEAYASDLNPVAVLICKALIELTPKFAGKYPVNPESRRKLGSTSGSWKGAQGLAEDVLYYGQWIREEARKRIGDLYPTVEITADMARARPDLKPLVGRKLTVIAWLWARTVKSPNPAFAHADVPLASSFLLSTKTGKQAWVDAIVDGDAYRFTVKIGSPKDVERLKLGTRMAGSKGAFTCLLSGTPMPTEYLRAQGKAGRLGSRLMAVVADSDKGRIYLSPDAVQEATANKAEPTWRPDVEFFQQALGFRVGNYGMTKWSDLFTRRQLVALTELSGLVRKARDQIEHDAQLADMPEDAKLSSAAYADAVAIFLGLVVSRVADWNNSLCRWESKAQVPQQLFGRQTVSMTWDYAESNPLSQSTGSLLASVNNVVLSFAKTSAGNVPQGQAEQADARTQSLSLSKIVSTDPPYYDNIGYADLSEFFYVWLRRSLKELCPTLFATVAVPKAEELVATPARHGGREAAEAFFLEGMTEAMVLLSKQSHAAFPVTIYYAFKQAESESNGESASTGWETFLEAVIRAGFSTTGTWPIRTENVSRLRGQAANALASSIILVCRPRSVNAPKVTRRDFLTTLKAELPMAVAHLQHGNIAPVDLAQAAIGPGMAIYTRYSGVVNAQDQPVSVRDALALINATLDEVLAEQEGDFDADTRWALAWFDQYGFADGEFGVAEVLSKAKVTSVEGIVDAGIARSKAGKVRLLKPNELSAGWNPTTDFRLTHWEMVHHMIRALEFEGESAAAKIAVELGSKAEGARELCYRLYTLCERKKRATEALSYNALVQSWPEIMRLAKERAAAVLVQQELV